MHEKKYPFLMKFSSYFLVMHLPEFGLNPFSGKIWLTKNNRDYGAAIQSSSGLSGFPRIYINYSVVYGSFWRRS